MKGIDCLPKMKGRKLSISKRMDRIAAARTAEGGLKDIKKKPSIKIKNQEEIQDHI